MPWRPCAADRRLHAGGSSPHRNCRGWRNRRSIQATLEHLVPKAKGLSFCLQLSELAGESPKKQKAILKDLIGTGGSKKTPKPPAKAPKELAEPKAKSDAKPSKSTDKEPAVKKTPEKKSVKKKS